eukprot:CAMPEP_0170187160 /NCGR_PEP_ID=MMETSP0040_2-20121228/41080_1 /TAXON_ID=641309 /ORGANISM="Lotharella oceanica, Strain CCMP622" /LENGTH=129 /DNA_ID=CAMNT_0010434133 /DNA_START=177 /DNA_END=563 /DNA_ORIENTATION=+
MAHASAGQHVAAPYRNFDSIPRRDDFVTRSSRIRPAHEDPSRAQGSDGTYASFWLNLQHNPQIGWMRLALFGIHVRNQPDDLGLSRPRRHLGLESRSTFPALPACTIASSFRCPFCFLPTLPLTLSSSW